MPPIPPGIEGIDSFFSGRSATNASVERIIRQPSEGPYWAPGQFAETEVNREEKKDLVASLEKIMQRWKTGQYLIGFDTRETPLKAVVIVNDLS